MASVRASQKKSQCSEKDCQGLWDLGRTLTLLMDVFEPTLSCSVWYCYSVSPCPGWTSRYVFYLKSSAYFRHSFTGREHVLRHPVLLSWHFFPKGLEVL